MIIGRVVGTVVSTRKHTALVGNKFLIIEPMEVVPGSLEGRIVAVDSVGAGIGEIVLVTTGSSARMACSDGHSPVDACIVGIVDDPKKIVIEEL